MSIKNKKMLVRWGFVVFSLQILASIFSMIFNSAIGFISIVMQLAILVFFLVFPFYFVKRDILSSDPNKNYKGWKTGFLIGVIFSFILLIAAMLDLLIRIKWLNDTTYVNHTGILLLASFIGSIMMIFVSTISGWVAQKKYG